MKRFSKLALVAAIAVLLLGAGDNPARRFDDLGHKLMCRCGCNQVLLECNHVGCEYSEKMRGELKTAIDRGDSDKVILAAFVEKYGATVLAAPTTTGFNLVAWIMPFVALAVGTVLAAWVVRIWKRRQRPAAVVTTTVSAQQLEALRQRAREETEI
jgi:cytochrome c-type biogenesis protein CcmH